MASKVAHKRLAKEYAALAKSPPPFVLARANENNMLECHFILRGPEDSPYSGGEYWGLIIFPSEYPFKPPGIKLMTPSGRFQPDRKICTSMSDYHPGTWNPAWSVATILTGLLSFMLSDELTTGSVRSTDEEKKIYAKRSHDYNRTQQKFRAIFPEYSDELMRPLPNMGETERGPNPKDNLTPSISARSTPSLTPVHSSTDTRRISPTDSQDNLLDTPSRSNTPLSAKKESPSSSSSLSSLSTVKNDKSKPLVPSSTGPPPEAPRRHGMPWYLFAGMAVFVSIIILKITG